MPTADQRQEQRQNSCSACRFYHQRAGKHRDFSQCRRHAPPAYDFLRYHELELIRDLAWSLRALARIEEPGEHDDVNTEATEAMSDACWPHVQPTDWCGEFERAS